jgi:hypothetical protein
MERIDFKILFHSQEGGFFILVKGTLNIYKQIFDFPTEVA